LAWGAALTTPLQRQDRRASHGVFIIQNSSMAPSYGAAKVGCPSWRPGAAASAAGAPRACHMMPPHLPGGATAPVALMSDAVATFPKRGREGVLQKVPFRATASAPASGAALWCVQAMIVEGHLLQPARQRVRVGRARPPDDHRHRRRCGRQQRASRGSTRSRGP